MDKKVFERIQYLPEVENEYGYTQTIRKGNTLYLSGVVGYQDGWSDDPLVQYRNTYVKIQTILATHGATMNDVAIERVYFTDAIMSISEEDRLTVRKEFFGDQFPASTWLGIKRLIVEEAMVEIEVTVFLP